jgi:putative tryptophan/tyrosine transport system substrate-binding protein
MRRRDFIGAVCSVVAGWPGSASAQTAAPAKRVAWFGVGRPDAPSAYVDALRAGLREKGWIEGSNLSIAIYAARRNDMDAVAHDLVASSPDIIVTQELTVFAVQRLKPAIPIVFGFSGDPVSGKLVDSLAHPGGDLTGMSYMAIELVGKRIELLKEWLPQIRRVAILARPQHPGEQRERQASEEACIKLGLQLSYFPMPFVPLDDLPRLEGVLHSILESQSEALVVFPDAAMFEASQNIAQFALQNKLPSVSGWAPFAKNGLLLSYGPDLREIYHALASYVDRILRGAKPDDLPVELPTKIEMVINAATAKSLGLAVPPTLAVQADEVIE